MTVLLVLLSVLCLGCKDRYSEARATLAGRTSAERWAMIRNCDSPEQKVDLYLAAMQLHPPDTSLASALAISGPAVVPSIMTRIRTATQASEIADLLLVVEEMEEESFYCVHCDLGLLSELTSIVERMRPSGYRGVAERIVKELMSKR